MNTTPFPRAQRCADEAAKRAGLLGYGLYATQAFQTEAVRLCEETDLKPAQIARRAVPAKSYTLAQFLRATYAALTPEGVA